MITFVSEAEIDPEALLVSSDATSETKGEGFVTAMIVSMMQLLQQARRGGLRADEVRYGG